MADLIVSEVRWKKGERGNQRFIIYDSDGKTPHPLTGHTYTFKFWLPGATGLKGSGSVSHVDAPNGVADYTVTATDTDTVANYEGEILETDTNLKSKTVPVIVERSSPA